MTYYCARSVCDRGCRTCIDVDAIADAEVRAFEADLEEPLKPQQPHDDLKAERDTYAARLRAVDKVIGDLLMDSGITLPTGWPAAYSKARTVNA